MEAAIRAVPDRELAYFLWASHLVPKLIDKRSRDWEPEVAAPQEIKFVVHRDGKIQRRLKIAISLRSGFCVLSTPLTAGLFILYGEDSVLKGQLGIGSVLPEELLAANVEL